MRDLQRRRQAGELVPSIFIGVGYGAIGDATRGLEWLQRGVDEHDIYIPENFFDPFLDPLRGDPRFERIVGEMGLATASGR